MDISSRVRARGRVGAWVRVIHSDGVRASVDASFINQAQGQLGVSDRGCRSVEAWLAFCRNKQDSVDSRFADTLISREAVQSARGFQGGRWRQLSGVWRGGCT
jgi:hypothetical protein